jgi:hypothetical protein
VDEQPANRDDLQSGGKRMNRQALRYLVLLAIGLASMGCYEKPQVIFFEPGEYKGRTDPLLALEATPEQQQRLEQRLRTVQMDR